MRRIRVTIAPVLTLLAVLSLSEVAPAQSQFAGKWHTKISRATGKPSITLNILVNEGKLSGMVVLVNPDRSETELQIQKPEVNGKVLEFETNLERTPFVWRLTLRGMQGDGYMAANDDLRRAAITERCGLTNR